MNSPTPTRPDSTDAGSPEAEALSQQLELLGSETGSPNAQVSQSEASGRQLDQLISRALAYRTGSELKALLDFTRRFPHIAPFNAMLLHVQNPGIRYALTADAWEKRYGRRVKQASRAYVILWTMGPVAFVFDLSDTEPIDPAIDRVPEIVSNPFPTKGQPPAQALRYLERACAKLGIEMNWRDLGTHLAGSVRPHANPGWRFLIQLNSKHTDAQNLATWAHELGHLFCGHLGNAKDDFWPDRSTLELAAREFEAEFVAYLICDRLNLDIGSDRYLAGYLKDNLALPNYSLDTVLMAAGKIEQMMNGTFRPKKPKPGA
jgi:IrrE N-terminal-like domain